MRYGLLVVLLGPLLSVLALEVWQMTGHLRCGVPERHVSKKMKAVVYEKHGDSSVLEVKDVLQPVAGDNQVVIKVAGAALNPVDFKMRRNEQPSALIPKPKIPGYDVSGTVVSAGKNSGFKEGDQVYGMMPILGQPWGSCSEYTAADAGVFALAPKLEGATLADMSALPLVGLTVVQTMAPALKELGNTEGKRILVHAGAGGVGTFAIMYAKNVLKMHVTTTCSARNADFVRSLGADVVVDYKKEKFEDVVQGADVVLDPMAWAYQKRTLEGGVLRAGGHYCHILSTDWEHSEEEKSVAVPFLGPLNKWMSRVKILLNPDAVRFHSSAVQPSPDDLKQIAEWVGSGKIRPVVEKRYTLDTVRDAMDHLEQGHARGKLVVDV